MGVKEVNAILERFADAGRDQLIPLLQDVQETEGYLSEETISTIAAHLKMASSKVYGVATFYNQFRFMPKGKYHVMCCRGTACHVKGSLKVLENLEKQLRIRPGMTTRDRLFSLEVVACMGACGLAPVINISGEFYAKATPLKVARILDDLRRKEQSNDEAAA